MEAKKQNIPEKGVLVQRDMETYAIVPYFPGSIVDSTTLRRIGDLAEKYNIKTIKTTSEGRIAIYGVKEEDLDNVWVDLGLKPGGHIGKCVRPAKSCIGNIYCKNGLQNSVEMSLRIDEHYCGI